MAGWRWWRGYVLDVDVDAHHVSMRDAQMISMIGKRVDGFVVIEQHRMYGVVGACWMKEPYKMMWSFVVQANNETLTATTKSSLVLTRGVLFSPINIGDYFIIV